MPARSWSIVLSAALLVSAFLALVPSSAVGAGATGCVGARFHAIAPTRVYDSADPGSARVGQVPITVDLSAVVPGDACAVVATVTGAAASSNTYVTAYAPGVTRPLASNLNLRPGVDSADLVTVGLGGTPAVDLYVNQGTARLVVDVAGWYGSSDPSATDVYVPLSPTRVLDTGYGIGTSAPSVGPGGTLTLTPGQLHVPANADAVVVNLTAVGGAAPTYVAAYPAGGNRPTTSDLNVSAGDTRAALATVRMSQQGLTFYNNAGTVRLVADVEGWYSPTATGTLFSTSAQPRVSAPLGAGSTTDVTITGGAGAPAAALFTLTVAGATASTVDRAYPTPASGSALPNVSNVNVDSGMDTPNLVSVALSPAGTVRLHNLAGSVRDLVDIAGYFTARPPGNDVSTHQCSGPSTAMPLPADASFGTINPTAGDLAFSGTNPCLAAEDSWAQATGDEEFYLPLADRGAASANYTLPPFPDAPRTCASGQSNAAYDADPGCAYDYGWDQAEDAVSHDVLPTGHVSVPWWLDVEAGQNFVNDTQQPQSQAQNAQVIRGAIDYLTGAGAAQVGIYSNAGSWVQLVGTQAAFGALPEWYAQAGLTAAQLVAACTTSFAGGPVVVVQDGSLDPGVLDTDLRC